MSEFSDHQETPAIDRKKRDSQFHKRLNFCLSQRGNFHVKRTGVLIVNVGKKPLICFEFFSPLNEQSFIDKLPIPGAKETK